MARAGTEAAPAERTGLVPVRLAVWGRTQQDAEAAVYQARDYPSARHWRVAEIERTVSETCTLQREDPGAIAEGHDYGYAWAVYPHPAPGA